MAIHDLTASLDLKQNLNIYATCKQLDNLNLILSIYDNSVQANLTNYDVRLKAMKADKVPLIQEHTGITINNNVVTIAADEQLTTTSGKTLVELQFINKTTGQRKATFNLALMVNPSTFEINATISTATYTLLQELENKLDQASDFLENVDEAIEVNDNLIATLITATATNTDLEANITTANTLITSGTALNNSLDANITEGTTLDSELDTANTLATSNIAAMGSFGDVSVLAQTVTGYTTDLNHMFNISPSVLKIPLANDYRGWQGVTVANDLIYVFTDRNESFGLENIISVYSLDGKLISEKRNAYTGLDPQGKFMSFGDGNEIDGFLYVTAYNINSGGSPLISRVVKFNLTDLSINQVYEIGLGTAESVTKNNNAFWVVYHDIAGVRKYDLNFTFLQQYNLSYVDAPNGLFQGTLWDGNYFYANLHGNNLNSDAIAFSQLRKYQFDGTNFNFIEAIAPPTDGCGQGLAKYGDYYFWNDRPNNLIVVSKNIKKGNVYSEILPYQNELSFKPTLLNNWEPYDTIYDRIARVTVSNGIVYLSGIIKNTVNIESVIFKLPSRYTPKYSRNFMVISDKGVIRIPIVGRNSNNPPQIGDVVCNNIFTLTGVSWISLDGISYPITD